MRSIGIRRIPRSISKYLSRNERESVFEKTPSISWHSLQDDIVLEHLKTSIEGLTNAKAEERLKEFGPNTLPTRKPPTILEVFFRQFFSPLIYVLLAAGLVALLLEETLDAAFVFVVVLINAVVGAIQEVKAEKSAEMLQQLLRTTVRVRRDSKDSIVPGEELVPGDIVLLESGAKVPADLRLLSSVNLLIDESLLTGESLPSEKRPMVLPEDTVVSDRRNLAFAGTTVSTGKALGVVVGTGTKTEIGRIADVVTQTESAKPPLLIRLEKFSKQISILVLGAAALLAIIAVAKGMPVEEVFFLAVALAVSAIPEGLPVAVTVALVVRVTRMSKRNVLVRRLAAVESLGSCTCIASDKTGTLTVNRQTVKVVCLCPREKYSVSGEGYSGEGEIHGINNEPPSPAEIARLRELGEIGVICNDASLVRGSEDWSGSGDAVDIALLALGYKVGLDPGEMTGAISYLGEIPFESEKRYAAKFFSKGDKAGVAAKGAVETILDFSATMRTSEGLKEIDRNAIEAEATDLSENGYRVLALAVGEVEPNPDGSPLGEEGMPPLTFLGLVGLIDPPRHEVREAVRTCNCAEIKVVMITGDHPATAFAIAKQLDISSARSEVVTGKQLSEAGSPDVPEYVEFVRDARVFARVTPLQKLEIVEALIRLGHFVAVTGDGVNDAPALRKANIGVAMGSGTDVAKDASSIIVTDDNFASIVAGIEEGRYAYDNIRKVVYLLVSTGAAEIILFILAIFIGLKGEGMHLALPLLAIQILWLNVVTNGIQHVTLAMEAGDPKAMTRPPRNPSEGIFNSVMIRQVGISAFTMGILSFALFYFLLVVEGRSYFQASNMTFLFMVILENIHVFNCRSELESVFRVPVSRNKALVAGVIGAQGIHILAMHIPIMQEVLRVEPVTVVEWVSLLLLALVLMVVMEVFKAYVRRTHQTVKCEA